ncbi:MAG TPA: hypothetical protein VIP11_20685 [Gemmatimonadaceae bacterium]
MMLPPARLLSNALLVAGLAGATACSGILGGTEPTARPPHSIVVVQGSNQSGQAGRELLTPIVFRVRDSLGVAVAGVTVSLAVGEGGGSVTPPSDTTDARGEFKTKWTLGPNIAQQSIVATVAGVTPVPVLATALLPTHIVLVQGNNQTAKPGAALTNSIIVRIIGGENVPMQGVTVGFQVLTGGGAMAPLTVVTNALGEASTKWTLGSVGANTALVTSGSLAPVNLIATATP